MKLAIVHDFLNQYGGAEKVIEAMHEAYPDAPVFTSIYTPDTMPASFLRMDVRATWMGRLPFLRRAFKAYLPLYPLAFAGMDLSGFDVVLSSSSAFAKGVRVPPGALHVCYCYTPMRFVWNRADYMAREAMPTLLRPLLPPVLRALQAWDLRTARRVDVFLSISNYIRERVSRCYGRDSQVVYPPVETASYAPAAETGDYFLVVSRLAAYKRIELAIEACNRLRKPLRIAGGGLHESALRRLAGPTVRFLGRLPQDELVRVMARCRAFIFPGEEDFGIAPVEAMAAGRPVVAFGAGGALETVVEGETGVFFRAPTADALAEALVRLDKMSFDPAACVRRAARFDKSVFQRELRLVVEDAFAAHRRKR